MKRKRRGKKSKLWIQKLRLKRGTLHRQLGISPDDVIPMPVLIEASRRPGLIGKRARLAINLRRLSKHHRK
jgi:hypothetical protein